MSSMDVNINLVTDKDFEPVVRVFTSSSGHFTSLHLTPHASVILPGFGVDAVHVLKQLRDALNDAIVTLQVEMWDAA